MSSILPKRPTRIAALVTATLLVSGVATWFYYCPSGTMFEFRCRYRVKLGMTLDEVEAMLGPGTPMRFPPMTNRTPSSPGVSASGVKVGDDAAKKIEESFGFILGLQLLEPRVGGDSFYIWDGDGGDFYVGLRDGRVCDKYFFRIGL